ncbi:MULTISPECIES: endonuclease/exonuclease/phosphatase family protein [unclassified Streptomyces]|uniref:endonuclease/exonuclease/phosphatase family protein n=1 Tax=unclassified Streptomyces TaxID=2593676 RepID=UPI002E17DAF4|nr:MULTISPECIES: endonuclease/exonuclease/phosphatase family protein [unclassified Streptomyces]
MTDDESGLLRVMTLNLHVDWPGSPRPWRGRRPLVAELLRAARPHLLGTQEGLREPLRELADDLGRERYAWVGQGREGGESGEFMAVGYDGERFEALEHGDFWLSDTPEVPGSETWGGGCPRMVTWLRLRDLVTGAELLAANTHFDHASAHARTRAAHLLADRLHTLAPGLPRIVTGDFNTAAGGDVHAALLGAADLVDAWEVAERRGPALGTFHDYGTPEPDGERIDWILVSPGTRVREVVLDEFTRDGLRPTDHLPVRAEIRVPRTPAR